NLAVSAGANSDVVIYDAPWRQGTRITIFDVSPEFDEVYNYQIQEYVGLRERLRELLAANDLPGVALELDGAPVSPHFSRRGGARVDVKAGWGEGTTATVKAYRRPPGDRHGGYFVRLGGLFQYKEPSRRGELKADIVVDLVTTARPGARNYPLNAARDGLQGPAGWAALDLAEEVERENESVARNDEDEVYDPEADDPGLRAGADELSALAAEAFAAPELQRALADAVGGIADFYAEQVKDPGVEPAADSAAPPSARAGDDGPRRPMVLPAGLAVGGGPGRGSPADALRDLLRQAQASRDAEAGGLPVLTPRAEAALDAVAAGQALDDSDLLTLATAVDRAAEVAVGPGGGGLVQVARGEAALSALAPARAGGALEGRRNPFGRLAGLRISRKGYDRRRAARFKKTFQRWIPHLTAWDATLRLVAGEARIRRGFKPGFVLDDAVIGLTATTPHRDAVVYLHPDRFAQVIKAHRERPIAIAAFLHGVACHDPERSGGGRKPERSEGPYGSPTSTGGWARATTRPSSSPGRTWATPPATCCPPSPCWSPACWTCRPSSAPRASRSPRWSGSSRGRRSGERQASRRRRRSRGSAAPSRPCAPSSPRRRRRARGWARTARGGAGRVGAGRGKTRMR
ncbi:MAG: hypothetical protein JNM72_12985, partial [Deltaproteobacteria bacterium]|nr:hypothetical protein [Deltaproteobacteria bacterium]